MKNRPWVTRAVGKVMERAEGYRDMRPRAIGLTTNLDNSPKRNPLYAKYGRQMELSEGRTWQTKP